MRRRLLRRGGMVLAGLLTGALIAVAVGYVYFRAVTDFEIAETVLRSIDLPADAFELEEMEGDSIAVVSADDVLIRSENGDTVVAAPTARMRLRLSSLAGEGPIVLDEVRLQRPYVNVVQRPDGEVNLARTMVVTAGGQEVRNEEGRPIELRDVRLENARVRAVTPYTPDSAASEPPPGLRLVRMGGTPMRVRWARDIDATLPRVRFGGGEGWAVEIGTLSASLSDPDVRVVNVTGSARQLADGRIAFGINDFRTPSSRLTASGSVALDEDGPRIDVVASAQPLALGDLRWVSPSLPEEGAITGSFEVAGGGSDGRYALAGTDVEVTALDSRVSGFFVAEVGGDRPATFGETNLSLDPIRIETIRSFGFGADLPYTGEIRGSVTSAGIAAGAGELNVDLTANFAPESGDVATSTLFLQGPLTLGEEMEVQLAGVRLAAQPLYLSALRPLVETDPERLRGVLRGAVVVEGSPSDLRIADGSLEYRVGDAQPSALTGLVASFRTEPEMMFDVSARAQPLALGTLAELFPNLPFRTARFAGPVRVAGTMDSFQVDAELAGSAGSITARGVVAPGDPLEFDLSGEVAAFNAEAVLTRSVPVEGPVTGSYAVEGTSQQFAFNVDLLQQGADSAQAGSFALTGSFRAAGDAPALVRVDGDVTNFNLGAVIGRPRLFPSRMTGSVDLSGGGTEPYRFDVDLRGETGVFDVAGYFAAGDVPLYAAEGQISGLDLRQLPGLQMLPSTSLRGDLALEGQGTTLETLAGSLRFNAVGSSIGTSRVERLDLDVAVEGGVLEVRTLEASLAATQVTARGRLGLTRPASGTPLQIRAVSRDLSRLAPLASGITGLPPRLTGSFLLQAELTGSIRAPSVTGAFRGQQLRYEGYRADRLEIDADVDVATGFEQVEGTIQLSGAQLVVPGLSADSLRFAAEGDQDSMAVRMVLSREAGSDVQLAGAVELVGRTPRGVLLDSLELRAGELAWQLSSPAAIRWGGVEGVRIDNFVLESTTDPLARILVDGNLPPDGESDLRAQIRRLDLELVRRLVPDSPDLAGVVDGDFILQGPTGDPELLVQGYGTGIRYEGASLDSLSFNLDYDEGRLTSRGSAWQGAMQVAAVEADVPLTLSISDAIPDFELLRESPLQATLRADSFPIALLTAGGAQVSDGAGTVVGQLDLSGTAENPQLSGYATVREGAVTAPQLGRRFERISGHLILDEQQILVDSLVVWSGGRAEVNGSVRVSDLERPELFLRSSFDAFHAIDNPQIANLTMSGSVRLEGVMPQPVLTGSVRLQEGAIYIPSLDEQVPLEIANVDVGQVGADTAVLAAVGPSVLEQIRISGLDVAVDEGVWLESDEANVQIRGDLVVIRSGPAMQMYGTLEAVRGTYDLPIGPLLREFDVVSGSVRFLGTTDFNPDIDITAEHQVQAGTAGGSGALSVLVHLTGTLQNPSIELTSNTRPPLPESELLSYLVFGQPSFRLQGTGALANQLVVQELVGGLLSRQLGDLGLPCEYFRLRGRPNILNAADPLGATSLECGIQVVEDVFVTFETGVLQSLTGGSSSNVGALLGVSLDWQVNNQVTATLGREPVQSALGTLYFRPSEVPYQFSGDVRGTWEFGRPAESELPVPDLTDLPVESAPPQAPLPENPPEPADSVETEGPLLPGAPVEEEAEDVPDPQAEEGPGGSEEPGSPARGARPEAAPLPGRRE